LLLTLTVFSVPHPPGGSRAESSPTVRIGQAHADIIAYRSLINPQSGHGILAWPFLNEQLMG
jgi:hypothetical protein